MSVIFVCGHPCCDASQGKASCKTIPWFSEPLVSIETRRCCVQGKQLVPAGAALLHSLLSAVYLASANIVALLRKSYQITCSSIRHSVLTANADEMAAS